ncbi:Cation/H(+) antiporter 15 [Rhynchospora pubera]|uniref:Cation/H(+) antiporter 15 n=1 Tax=Rhynchospora pubera TaxID=906938 RepID=A0AAV8E542_9POAL|nr:Cation/H(+) antiporter 15 [Rhynchospora pubera]
MTSTDNAITPEDLYHNDTAAQLSREMFFCHRADRTISAGIFLGDLPLDYSFPLFLYQITVIFVSTRLVHAVLRNIGVPIVISQLIAGVLLGPSFMGRSESFEQHFFNPSGWEQLNTLAYLSFVLFVFIIGVKTDIGLIFKSGKKATAVAFCSTGLSQLFLLVTTSIFGKKTKRIFTDEMTVINLSLRWSMTSYVVLSCALGELNLLTSKLGRLAMSSALIADFCNTFFTALMTGLISHGNGQIAAYSLISLITFSLILWFVVRPFVVWLIHRAPESRFLDEALLVLVILLALASALVTQLLGYNSLGALLLGFMLPGGAPLGVTVVERLDRLVAGIFLPVFVALAGLRMDPYTLFKGVRRLVYFQSFVLISVVGKFVGTIIPCLYFRLQLKDAIVLGLMNNFKGIREVDYTAQWQDLRIVDNQQYTILMIWVIFLGGLTSILVKYLYRPEDRFLAYKHRSIHSSKPGDELRVLACIHSQTDVTQTLSILDATNPTQSSPLCVYLIHLIELAGRSDAIIRPHKEKTRKPNKQASSASESDRIVNAFQSFERQLPQGAVTVLPYICISPYNTMHEDVCTVALDKKAVLVLIPFHQRYHIDGSTEPPNLSILTLNLNVISYAPCSVGILIDRGAGNAAAGYSHQVAVYFIGGPDDREALALAARMAENPTVGLTVVRFREKTAMRRVQTINNSFDWKENDDERIDEEMIDDFVKDSVDDHRVLYREEVVSTGEELVGVIRETSSLFSLLIVGRRETKNQKETSLMAGLSEWSEHPELGVIGDLLASADFGCMVSTLVIQQQARIGISDDKIAVANADHSQQV